MRRGARFARAIVVGLAIAVLAWVVWRATRGSARAPGANSTPADTLATGFRAAALYFPSTSGDDLVIETRDMIEQSDLHERIATLVTELARGPRGEAVAAVPPETAVLHVYLDDRGLLTLDLSRGFRAGFRGGATAERMAIGALVRTLAANVPEVRRVQFAVEGAPLPSLGGHLPLEPPLDVAEWP